MNLIDKIIEIFIRRMSQEDKEKLAERVAEKFFNSMSPEDKQKLIEKMLPKLLEGVDLKEFFSQIMKTMWKTAEADNDKNGILTTMSKMVGETGDKLSEIIPAKVKKML